MYFESYSILDQATHTSNIVCQRSSQHETRNETRQITLKAFDVSVALLPWA